MKLRARRTSCRSKDKLRARQTDCELRDGFPYTNMAPLITLTLPMSVCAYWNGYGANTREICIWTYMFVFSVIIQPTIEVTKSFSLAVHLI